MTLEFSLEQPNAFVPKAAWLRAGIYFCACYLAVISSGVFDRLFRNPVSTTEQIADSNWWLGTCGLILLVTVAYWGICARYTLRFDRHPNWVPQILFGLLWGITSGLLFLSFYHVARVIGNVWTT